MGKRQRNQQHTSKRDDNDIATDSEVLRNFIKKQTLTLPAPVHFSPKINLQPLQDRRTWHPDQHRSLQRLDGSKHRLKLASPVRAVKAKLSRPHGPLPHRVAFEAPKKLLLCIRRARRRAVLFAFNKTRKGAGSRKRRNQWSDIKC